jgi:hypothetical protein
MGVPPKDQQRRRLVHLADSVNDEWPFIARDGHVASVFSPSTAKTTRLLGTWVHLPDEEEEVWFFLDGFVELQTSRELARSLNMPAYDCVNAPNVHSPYPLPFALSCSQHCP